MVCDLIRDQSDTRPNVINGHTNGNELYFSFIFTVVSCQGVNDQNKYIHSHLNSKGEDLKTQTNFQ